MYRILICEDEALERQVLRHLLENSNLPVTVAGEAASGKEAVTLVETLQPEIVLMDIKMPGLDGLQATRLIKEKHPQVEIIIVTAYGDFSYSRQAIKYHVADYLLKPVQPGELYDTIKEVLARLEQRTSFQAGALEHVPLKPDRIGEIAGQLLLGRLEQARQACRNLVEEFLSRNPGAKPNLLAAFAFEILVITTQQLSGAGLREDAGETGEKLAGEIKSITTAGDMTRWCDKMLEQFSLALKRQQHRSDQAVIEQAKRYIRDNYTRDITLTRVASEVHLSPAYLSRIFKQKTGTCFSEYLTRYRLEQAKKLLLNTDKTIDEIAYAVGYGNNSYFTAVFRKFEHQTPSEFRAREKPDAS